jgi:DUF4097 and DUF4098 domain-containing protein YvlB
MFPWPAGGRLKIQNQQIVSSFKTNLTMKNSISVLIVVCLILAGNSYGQEYKHNVKNAKKIEISNLTGSVKIVGTSGSELIIKATDAPEIPERAKGLKPLSSAGPDNTQIGLTISETENIISVKGATKQSAESGYTFMIPNSIPVSLDYTSPFVQDDVLAEDFGGELEISSLNASVKCLNVTGPLILDVINGDIEITFSSINQNSPMSIKSINDDVDITIPASAKATFDLSSLHGDIYTDLDIQVEKNADKDDLSFMGGMNEVEGILNGGGVKITVSSINGNLFLRKK